MQKLIAANAKLQQKSEVNSNRKSLPTRYPRRRRNHLNLSPGVYLTFKAICRAIAACGGCCDWDAAKLAHHCGVGVSTYFTHSAILVSRGLIVRVPRPGHGKYNETSLLMRPKVLNSSTLDSEREVLSPLTSKTNTPTASRGLHQNNHPAFRQLIEEKRSLEADKAKRVQYAKTLEAENRSLRSIVRGRDHSRTRPDASLGVYRSPAEDPERLEARMAARATVKAAKEKTQSLLTAHCEACEGSGKLRTERAGMEFTFTCWECFLGME
jgi:hypothetical protein